MKIGAYTLAKDYPKTTINKLVENLQKKGYRITRRMFWYYIEMGIIPKPHTAKGERGVQGFYHADMIEPLERVLKWRDDGNRLDELWKLLYDYTTSHIGEVYKKNGLDAGPFLPDTLLWSNRDAHRGRNHPVADYLGELQHNAHEEREYRAKQIVAELAEDTMWRSDREREKIVLQRAIEDLKSEWKIGYYHALGDIYVLKNDFMSLKDNAEMVQLENRLLKRMEDAQNKIEELELKVGVMG